MLAHSSLSFDTSPPTWKRELALPSFGRRSFSSEEADIENLGRTPRPEAETPRTHGIDYELSALHSNQSYSDAPAPWHRHVYQLDFNLGRCRSWALDSPRPIEPQRAAAEASVRPTPVRVGSLRKAGTSISSFRSSLTPAERLPRTPPQRPDSPGSTVLPPTPRRWPSEAEGIGSSPLSTRRSSGSDSSQRDQMEESLSKLQKGLGMISAIMGNDHHAVQKALDSGLSPNWQNPSLVRFPASNEIRLDF